MRIVEACVGIVFVLAASACAPNGGPPEPPVPPTTAPSRNAPDVKAPGESKTRRAPVRINVALTGDFLIHSTVWAQAETSKGFDFYPLVRPVAPVLRQADLAICHLETPLAPPGGPFESYPLFSTPPALLDAIVRAGYDGCTTASNHTVDQGFEGVNRTIGLLNNAGLKHTGSYRTPTAPKAAVYSVKGLRVASLSYTYGTNGMPVERSWSVNLINAEAMKNDARRAKRAGADIVIVGVHWGSEYQTEPDQAQLDLARNLTKSKHIDLVYGHHAHVVQPVRKINGKWVIFGLGNFLAGQAGYQPGVDDGVIGQVRFTRSATGVVRVARPRYLHTHIGQDFTVRPSR